MSQGFTDRSGLDAPATIVDPVVVVCDLTEDRVKAIHVFHPAADGTPRKLSRISAWLPKAAIRFEHELGARVRVTLPKKLAIEKGLVAAESAGQGRLL